MPQELARIDDRTEHCYSIAPQRLEHVRIDGIVEIGPPNTAPRPLDLHIAAVAEDRTGVVQGGSVSWR